MSEPDGSIPERTRSGGVVWGVAGILVGVLVLVGALAAVATWLPSLNPFHSETVDRTGPSVLRSLSDLSEYHAATAHYETVVDIEEGETFLPSLILGERVLYVGKGDVDAVVDFGELDERRVTLSGDGTSATVRLPAPLVDKPSLDLEHSYVVLHDTGLLNKFKGSALERDAQLKAVAQMTAAANGEGALVDRAKENTTAMLRGLFGAIGYSTVTIIFDQPSG